MILQLSILSSPAKNATHVPVHQVQVQVVGPNLLERVLDGELNVFGVVVDLKQLGSDENLGSGDTRLADTLSDLILVTVTPGAAIKSVSKPLVDQNR